MVEREFLFESWEECYKQHMQASLDIEQIIVELKKGPTKVPKETAIAICHAVFTPSLKLQCIY